MIIRLLDAFRFRLGCVRRVSVLTGIDVLERDGFAILKDKRVGLFTNPTGVNRALESTLDSQLQAANDNLFALFSPEHGFVSSEPDGSREGQRPIRELASP